MRISFDLDDTLILKSTQGAAEPELPPLIRSGLEERLRMGTRELIEALRIRGCEIWIYSNSYRGRTELLAWFSQCSIPVSDVVNQQLHDLKRGESGLFALRPCKYPPWFGIDIHVDDSLELEEDSRQHGFAVVRVAPDDPAWTQMVLDAVDKAMKEKETNAPIPDV